jgi:hypothetical protein
MAVLAGTYKRYEAIGIRETLSDVIYNIDPEEVPIVSNAGRGKVDNTDYEWQTDSLATPAANAQLEGDDISTFDSSTPTVRLKNYTQISRKTLIISGTLEATSRAGRKSELSYQAAKRGKELKRDMETIIASNQGAQVGAAGTARTTGSLLAFIKTNTSFGATGANPSYTNTPTATRTDGTLRTWTETILKAVVQSIWTNGGDLKMVMVGGALKQVTSTFTGIASLRFNAEGNKPTSIIGAADIYVSDFGNLTVVPNRFMRTRDALFLDPEMYEIVYLRPFKTEALAKTGDAEKRMMITEWGLKVKNEKALGLATDLQ